MTDNQYWDLFECRWVRYAAPEAAAVAELPRPRTTEADVATSEVAEGAATG